MGERENENMEKENQETEGKLIAEAPIGNEDKEAIQVKDVIPENSIQLEVSPKIIIDLPQDEDSQHDKDEMLIHLKDTNEMGMPQNKEKEEIPQINHISHQEILKKVGEKQEDSQVSEHFEERNKQVFEELPKAAMEMESLIKTKQI